MTQNIQQHPKNIKAGQEWLWITGGILLLGGIGFSLWYFSKKKKTKQEDQTDEIVTYTSSSSSNTAPVNSRPNERFRCKSWRYPLEFGSCHADVKILQAHLKSLGADLGRFGPKKDGVDGQMGEMTVKAAQLKLGKSSFLPRDIENMKKSLNA